MDLWEGVKEGMPLRTLAPPGIVVFVDTCWLKG